jgi:hypothetical protein
MKHEIDKVMKLVEEVGAYLLRSFESTTLSVTMRRETNRYYISINCPIHDYEELKLTDLRDKLAQNRSPELEDYYWQLPGNSFDANALRIVPILCDLVTVNFEGGVLTVNMERNTTP